MVVIVLCSSREDHPNRSMTHHKFTVSHFFTAHFAGRDDINSTESVKGKSVGAGSITSMGAGLSQFRQLDIDGISWVADPKQVVFTHNERLIVEGVLDGDFEIGFARTDQIERYTDKDGNFLDEGKFCNPL